MRVIAVDLGATNGKIFSAELVDGRLKLEEISRFRTGGSFLPTNGRKVLVWNTPKFFEDIIGVLESIPDFVSLGVDTWGVDFALLDSKGRLIFLPYHYRDSRTAGVMEKALEKVDKKHIYEETGIQFMPINTIYQLYSMVLNEDEFLRIADTLLMIPDLFNYWFTGKKVSEYTIATTSQCFSVPKEKWALDILEKLGIPPDIFPEVVKPGTILGESVVSGRRFKVIATTSHDTASAVVAVPFESDGVYISSGTWSLIGVELEKPLITPKSMEYDFTNEGGYGKIRFLKNATGMWILEECNRQWKLDYGRMIDLARSASAFSGFVDPDYREFMSPGDMVGKIADYLKSTNQNVPESIGEFIRLVLESLAFNYRWVLEKLEDLVDRVHDVVHIVGGASRNDLLNQFVANATGKIVRAGPHEATSVGNSLVQMISLGEIENLPEAREIVRRSFDIKTFYPENVDLWNEMYQRWKSTTGKS